MGQAVSFQNIVSNSCAFEPDRKYTKMDQAYLLMCITYAMAVGRMLSRMWICIDID